MLTDGRTDRRTDIGYMNLIGGLVTRLTKQFTFENTECVIRALTLQLNLLVNKPVA